MYNKKIKRKGLIFKRVMREVKFVYFDGEKSYLTWCKFGYIVSALKKIKDVSVEVIDINSSNIEEKCKDINDNGVSIVLMAVKYSTYSIAQKALGLLHDKHYISWCYILPTEYPQKILIENEKIDSVIVGEVEYTAIELCERVIKNKPLEGCKGVVYKDNGKVKYNENRKLIQDLDLLPFPDRESFPHDKRFFHVLGSRGCMGNCSFCNMNSMYKLEKGQRFRKIECIMQEIDILVEKYNCKYIGFSDSTFCVTKRNKCDVERLKELYVALKKRTYKIKFFINLRAEQISEETINCIDKLNEVGLTSVFVGLESWLEKDLRLYNKIAHKSDNVEAIKIINNYISKRNKEKVLNFEFGFINFNPYSSIEDIKENIMMLKKFGINITPKNLLSKVELYHNTRITKEASKNKIELEPVSLYKKEIGYKFLDKKVEELYSKLEGQIKVLGKYNDENFPILYNIYIETYGKDITANKIMTVFNRFYKIQSQYLFYIFCKNIGENVQEGTIDIGDVKKARLEYEGLMMKMVIRLKKANELIYY